MIINWRATPFVRLVLPLAMGIGLAANAAIHLPLSTLPLLLVCLLLLHLRKPLPQQQWWFGSLLFCFLTSFGYLLYQHQVAHFYPQALHDKQGQELTAAGKILTIEGGEKYRRIGLQLQSQLSTTGNISTPLGGRILLYLPDSSALFEVGDLLVFDGRIQSIPGPKNPKAFDFSAYMQSQGYYVQLFVKGGQWEHIPQRRAAWLQRSTSKLKEHCLSILQKHLTTPASYAIGAALITGHRQALSPAVRDSYAKTGAMHVLAVSGLHVGLIYVGLQYILGFFGGWHGRWKWLRVGCLLAGIWSFVYFTGATASVVRAGCMFSFIIVGQSLRRFTNIYNTIAASAFCMLIFHPHLLLNIGFQLSYLALLGIVFFQPFIYRAIYLPNKFVDYCWKLSSVALAAQLTTLPISLFYFHQFPVYFLLSGLVVVPAAMVILGLGLGLFVLDAVPLVGAVVGQLLDLTIKGMNTVIFFLEGLPYSSLQNIWPSLGLLICLFLGVMLLAGYLMQPNIKWSYALASLLILISAQISWQSWQRFHQREIVIYQVKGQTVIDCISGRRCLRILDRAAEVASRNWAIANYESYRGIRQVQEVHWQDAAVGQEWFYQNGFLQFQDFRLALLDKLPAMPADAPLSFHLVLLHNSPAFTLSELKGHIQSDRIVWDHSNNYWLGQEWSAACKANDIDGYDVREDGALVIRL